MVEVKTVQPAYSEQGVWVTLVVPGCRPTITSLVRTVYELMEAVGEAGFALD